MPDNTGIIISKRNPKYCELTAHYYAWKNEYARFENEVLDCDNYQGNAVVNYTSSDVPYTRVIEHKHFEFGTQPKTVISREYPAEWQRGTEPYYPINDEKIPTCCRNTGSLQKAVPMLSSAADWDSINITIWIRSSVQRWTL